MTKQTGWRYYAPYEPIPDSKKPVKASKNPVPPDFTECEKWRGARDVFAPDKFAKALSAELAKVPVPLYKLAERAGVHRENLYSWRNGDSRPSDKTWTRIKQAIIDIYDEMNGG